MSCMAEERAKWGGGYSFGLSLALGHLTYGRASLSRLSRGGGGGGEGGKTT